MCGCVRCVCWVGSGVWVSVLLMLNPTDGLDLRCLTVGTPILPVLVISAVLLTLHDVLPAPVTWELVTHKTTQTQELSIDREKKSYSANFLH